MLFFQHLGQSGARGLCSRSARVPGSRSDALIQRDRAVIYKVSLDRGLGRATSAGVHGVSFIERNPDQRDGSQKDVGK